MFSAEDQRLTDAAEAAEVDPRLGGIPEPYAGDDAPQGFASAGSLPEPQPEPESASEVAGRGLPLIAGILLADLALALVAVIAFIVIGVQRLDDATLDQRRTVYREDLVVFFVVGAIFALVAYSLHRAGQAKAALVQVVVVLVAFGLGGYAAVGGSPSETAVISPIVPDESPSPVTP